MKLSRKPENLRERILLIKYILFFATTFVRSGFATLNIDRLETEMSAERRVGLHLSDRNHNIVCPQIVVRLPNIKFSEN